MAADESPAERDESDIGISKSPDARGAHISSSRGGTCNRTDRVAYGGSTEMTDGFVCFSFRWLGFSCIDRLYLRGEYCQANTMRIMEETRPKINFDPSNLFYYNGCGFTLS